MKDIQAHLPFPPPVDATPWPNGLGFDWQGWEFWGDKGGRRETADGGFDVYGRGSWVAVLCQAWTPCQ